jgi:hypothetical protein
VTVKVVDNGGTATTSDTNGFATAIGAGCFAENPDLPPLVPLHGYAVVFDAPPPTPTSKEQCKSGGWQAFDALFENQGQCVAFVHRGPKPQ